MCHSCAADQLSGKETLYQVCTEDGTFQPGRGLGTGQETHIQAVGAAAGRAAGGRTDHSLHTVPAHYTAADRWCPAHD
jgi:hypothetical protein